MFCLFFALNRVKINITREFLGMVFNGFPNIKLEGNDSNENTL